MKILQPSLSLAIMPYQEKFLRLKLEQMGNFYGFFIPKEVLEKLAFTKDEEYELTAENGQLIITKEDDSPTEFEDEELDAWSSWLEENES